MGKINFSLVEQALEEGIRRFGIKQLLHLADLSGTLGTGKDPRQASAFDDKEIRSLTLMTVAQNLRILYKYDPEVYKKLAINRRNLEDLADHPENLQPTDWEKIQEIRKKIEAFRKELHKKVEAMSDEELIQSEKKKHIYKRFNVNEDWLPLH